MLTLKAAIRGSLAVACLAAGAAAAAPGDLDPSFGKGGEVTTPIDPNGLVHAALQADGKIVAAVSLPDYVDAALVFGVVRYLPTGALDTSYGKDGVVRTAFTSGFNIPTFVAAAGGKVLVAGTASTPSNTTRQLALARYDDRGALDPTFGDGGKVLTTLLGFTDAPAVVLVQPDGKILVGGSAQTCFGYRKGCLADTAVVRYGPDGRLDASFGQGGSVVSNLVGAVSALALEPDGSILVLGTSPTGNPPVTRLTSAGVVENVGLNGGALTAIAAGGADTFQPDGKIVAATEVLMRRRSEDYNIRVERFTLGDALDGSFNSPLFDFVGTGPNLPSTAQAVVVGPDGAVWVGGIAPPTPYVSSFGLARLSASGALDTAFGRGGSVSTQFTGSGDQITALLLQPDGNIVAVGATLEPGTMSSSIALARYLGR
jgi:uncharacterized delta-60 repeat protein